MVKLIIEKKPPEKRESPKGKHNQKLIKTSAKKVMTLADTPYVPKEK